MRDLLPNILWDSWTNKHHFMNKKLFVKSVYAEANKKLFIEYGDFQELYEHFCLRAECDKFLPFYFTRVWILRYQGWFFFFTAFHKPDKKPFEFLKTETDSEDETEVPAAVEETTDDEDDSDDLETVQMGASVNYLYYYYSLHSSTTSKVYSRHFTFTKYFV